MSENTRSLDRMVSEINQRDGIVEVKRQPPAMRVIPYDEVSRRLQARPK